MRTEFDLEMMQEMGFCSRDRKLLPPSQRTSARFTAVRYVTRFLSARFLLVVDESHATIPPIGGMYEGDRSTKTDFGRIPDFGFPAR